LTVAVIGSLWWGFYLTGLAVHCPSVAGADLSVSTSKLGAAAGAAGGGGGLPLTEFTDNLTSAVGAALDPAEIRVSARNNQLMFDVEPRALVEATLRDPDAWRRQIAVHGQGKAGHRTALIEFSSPNIAKPFHAGHLRSTVIGGYLARLYAAHGHTVHTVNYLGDWGKQFGLLGVGFKRYGDRDALAADPIRHLFDVYVATNQAAEDDPSLDADARRFFAALEAGAETETALWQHFRDLSVASYETTYARLGVYFDEVAGESMYSTAAADIVTTMEVEGRVEEEANGALLADLAAHGLGKVMLRKADGTTLYISRDMAAATDRHTRIGFDEMLYVAGAPQTLHFKQLFEMLRMNGHDWSSTCHHVPFGAIRGMSTRKGTVVFLQDILDEARDRMATIIRANPAKLGGTDDIDTVAEAIGLAAVVVQDLKARRIKDYTFDWNRILKVEGDTGPFLMYTHARLCSIERVSMVMVDPRCDLTHLVEPEAIALVEIISRYVPNVGILRLARWRVQHSFLPLTGVRTLYRYEETLNYSLDELEPAVLIQYLITLARQCSKAIAVLRVKDSPPEVALPRALLFRTARTTLGDGLRLLGLTPLERM
jgi:arginyl-tRNA synthetase